MDQAQIDTFGREIAQQAAQNAPRRRRPDRPEGAQQPMEPPQTPETPAEAPAPQPLTTRQQLLTPNSLKIAETIDRMEREREKALDQRNDLQDQLSQALARIEQFEHRNAEIQREKEELEAKLSGQAEATQMYKAESIRLSDAMESVISLLQQKLSMPDS